MTLIWKKHVYHRTPGDCERCYYGCLEENLGEKCNCDCHYRPKLVEAVQ